MLRPWRSFPSSVRQDVSRDSPASRYSSQGSSSFHNSAINETMLSIGDDLRIAVALTISYNLSAPLRRYANNYATSSGGKSTGVPEGEVAKGSQKVAQFTFDAAKSQSFKGGKKHFWAMARLDCEHKGDKCSRDEWASRFDRINRKKRRKNQMIFTVRDFTFVPRRRQ